MVTQKRALFAMHSTARNPMAPALVQADGALETMPASGKSVSFPSDRLVVPQRVVFKSPDGLSVHGQLFAPSGKKSAKQPAVLFFHGGPQRQMLLGWHPMGAYTHMYAMNQFLASRGLCRSLGELPRRHRLWPEFPASLMNSPPAAAAARLGISPGRLHI